MDKGRSRPGRVRALPGGDGVGGLAGRAVHRGPAAVHLQQAGIGLFEIDQDLHPALFGELILQRLQDDRPAAVKPGRRR